MTGNFDTFQSGFRATGKSPQLADKQISSKQPYSAAGTSEFRFLRVPRFKGCPSLNTTAFQINKLKTQVIRSAIFGCAAVLASFTLSGPGYLCDSRFILRFQVFVPA